MSHEYTEGHVFTVPKTGFYQVRAAVTRYEKTGRFVWQKNPRRRWYSFWRPKQILVPEFRAVEEYSGSEVKLLVKGEAVEPVLQPIRRIEP